jgi:uncharacterized surface protein with fasciclin (FAS1) repeats
MKSSVRLLTTWLLLGGFVFLTSCTNDDDDAPAPQTLYDLVGAGSDLTLLKAAIDRAGLANDLRSGTLTLFAPTDAAIQAAGFANAAAIQAADVNVLRAILTYHVQAVETLSSAIPPAANTEITMLSTGKAYVTKAGTAVSINGVRVVRADVDAANGVMHVIDKVMLPPAGNLVTMLSNATLFPNHTYLVAAVTRAAGAVPTLAAAVNGPGPLTVFAPTNAAFIEAGFPTIAAINAAPATTLAAVLTNHVALVRAYSTNLVTGDVATAGASPITVTVGTPVTLRLKNAGTVTANVTAADFTATNGVIHVIDKVLR